MFFRVFPSLMFSRDFFYYFHGRKCVWNNNFTSLFIHTRRRRPRVCSPHMIFRLFESVPRALSFSRSKHRQLRRRRHGMEIARLLFITTHLQFSFGHVDLPPVNEFDDELKVSECHLRRHDNDRMLAGILDEELLEEAWTCWQDHLKVHERYDRFRRNDVLFKMLWSWKLSWIN